ncbi:MAG: hypothetical protein Q8R97_12105, partial [Brevundimonas sp.]|nr:hypothetical protein [Brevundimonas sp.]
AVDARVDDRHTDAPARVALRFASRAGLVPHGRGLDLLRALVERLLEGRVEHGQRRVDEVSARQAEPTEPAEGGGRRDGHAEDEGDDSRERGNGPLPPVHGTINGG